MVSEDTRLRVYADWAERLGLDALVMTNPQVIVVAHAPTLNDYKGIYCFYNGTTCAISAPAEYVSRIETAVAGHLPDKAFDVDLIISSLDTREHRIIGPAYQGYADKGSFVESSADGVRTLSDEYKSLLHDFRMSCRELEWQHSSIDENKGPILVKILDGKIVAAGAWRVESGGRIYSVGIISHPSYRGQGHAKAVVSRVTSLGLRDGAMMRYQTLKSNTPSVAIANSLGYEELGLTLAIRLSM